MKNIKRKIDKEAASAARHLKAKRVAMVVFFDDGTVQYGGNAPIHIDESGGKNGSVKRLTFLIPTE